MYDFRLETSRLLLREFRTGDAEGLHALNADPEVLRYTADPPFASVDAAREFIDNYDHYRAHGFGRWAVIRKSEGKFIGWCGLKFNEESEIDLGFRIQRNAWGNGFASEAAEACMEYGFEALKLPYLLGRAERGNVASHAVLKKVGMEYWRGGAAHGFDDVTYWVRFREARPIPCGNGELLRVGRIALRPLLQQDLQGFFLLESNPNVLRYADGEVLRLAEAKERLHQLITRREDDPNQLRVWAALDAANSNFVGTVALVLHGDDDVEIGMRLLESQWRLGLGADGVRAVTELARRDHPSRQIYALCDRRNLAAIAAVSKAGYSAQSCDDSEPDVRFTPSAL